jgi:NAD(P) transhydrogenase
VGEAGVPERYDLVVIGAGAAGEKGAAQAAYFGKRVAVVERAGAPGGATVHTGTLPSKTLREAALFVSGYRQRDLYGISVEVGADLGVAALIRRKDAVRHAETARIVANLGRHGVSLIRGDGRFAGTRRVEVLGPDGDSSVLEGEVVLIATGSRPRRPATLPFDDPGVYDSDTILGIERLPSSLVVLGGGVIGCEYASTFAALGVRVDLVEPRTPLLSFLDREIVDRLLDAMSGLGVTFHLDVTPDEVVRDGDALRCTLSSGAVLRAEAVLASMGRSGNTGGLRAEAAGVEVDGRGRVVVDADYETAAKGVYAAGDVIGFPGLASTSMEQARVAVCHAFGFTYKQEVAGLLPYGVYTIPEVSSVGLSEEDARRDGIEVVVGRASFAENARGQIIGDREGMTKLVFERSSRRLVGCHCLGERASELVHVGQAVMTLEGTVDTLIEMVFNYPTLSETYKYAAYDALARLGPV